MKNILVTVALVALLGVIAVHFGKQLNTNVSAERCLKLLRRGEGLNLLRLGVCQDHIKSGAVYYDTSCDAWYARE